MAYTVKTVDTGDYRTVYVYSERPEVCGRRRGRVAPTRAAQQKLNEKMSEATFRNIIHENFTASDFSLRLDYNRFISATGANPTLKEATGKLRYYFSRLKDVYSAYGVKFEYIYVTEVGVRSGKIHHHLIMRGDADASVRMALRDACERLWLKNGYGNTAPLVFNENGVKGLVHYFIKDPVTQRRWACSVGLRRPTAENGGIERRRDAVGGRTVGKIDREPFNLDYIIKSGVCGEGFIPVMVRPTAVFTAEDVHPATDAEASGGADVRDGLTYPDFGGYFIEIWCYREGTELFKPLGEKPKRLSGKRKKKTTTKRKQL